MVGSRIVSAVPHCHYRIGGDLSGDASAVLLATIAGRTTNEISQIEHIPIGTAKTRLRTGLAKLAAGLAEEPVQ